MNIKNNRLALVFLGSLLSGVVLTSTLVGYALESGPTPSNLAQSSKWKDPEPDSGNPGDIEGAQTATKNIFETLCELGNITAPERHETYFSTGSESNFETLRNKLAEVASAETLDETYKLFVDGLGVDESVGKPKLFDTVSLKIVDWQGVQTTPNTADLLFVSYLSYSDGSKSWADEKTQWNVHLVKEGNAWKLSSRRGVTNE